MSDAKNTEIREIDLLPDVHKEVVKMYSYMKEKHPGRLWMAKLQMDHWDDICTAHERGKKLILTSTNTPAELIYAFDAVPFVPETLIMRYANSEKTFKYLDLADQYVSHQLCSINRGQIGYYLSGDLRMKPDAILATVTPCDSSRVAYTAAAKILDIPSFCLDTPYRQDERGYGYLAEQLKEACKFLEEVTGNKLDMDKLKEIVERGNKAARLLTACSKLRQITPCPLPGSLLVLNEMVGGMMGSQGAVDFLQAEYDYGVKNLAAGKGVTPGPEEFRVIWVQNMLWNNAGIVGWMEKAFNAVLVMDGFGYEGYKVIDTSSEDSIFLGLGQRTLNSPMVHGAAGPAEPWIRMVDRMIGEYKVNVSMFAGHVGCKHTWAASKLVKDYIYEKYGLPTLTFDEDGIDIRYQTADQIKAVITEYMETLIENKKKGNL